MNKTAGMNATTAGMNKTAGMNATTAAKSVVNITRNTNATSFAKQYYKCNKEYYCFKTLDAVHGTRFNKEHLLLKQIFSGYC